MERQFSRQRKSEEQSQMRSCEESTYPNAVENNPAVKSTHSRVGICSFILCVLIIVVYILQTRTPDPLPVLLSSLRKLQGKNTGAKLHDPDSARPRIELHPEDHAYRQPVTQHLDWPVTAEDLRPDGVLKRVYLINGRFPGPTVECRSGDTLVITVRNALKDGSITIHWHGLHVTNSMDGASSVTQSVVSPGETFVYNLTVPMHQSGTFWYHAHSGLHRTDGLYGGLIVHQPAVRSTVRGLFNHENSVDSHRHNYDKELLLLVGDWYHRSAEQVMAWYMRAGSFGNEPVSDSLLINGVGFFDCAMAVPARPLDCIADRNNFSFLDLDRSLHYRIRVVNTGSLAGFTLTFEHEHLDLIQLDSIDVEQQHQIDSNSVGILYPGQRMDFILHSPPGRREGKSSMTVELDPENFRYPNPALTPKQTFPINQVHHRNFEVTEPSAINPISLAQVASASSILAALPLQPQQTHVVYTKIEKLAINDNEPWGFFNRTSWRPQNDPPTPLIDLPRQQWDKNQFALSTGPEPVWVDLVVNNLDEGPHPFHLHGHHFYILAIHKASRGWGSYNPFADRLPPGLNGTESKSPYNLSRASLRDTVHIPRRGYAVLRFRAENPGIWMFHCHVTWHLGNGMAMLVNVMRG